MFIKEDMKFYAALLACVCGALLGIGVVPHPYDKWLMGFSAVGAAIATFNMTPPSKKAPDA